MDQSALPALSPIDAMTPTPPLSLEEAWRALDQVLDPEVPVLSVVELGIVRGLAHDADGTLCVSLTPTYSGCPATEVIADAVQAALRAAGAERVRVVQQLSPAWTSDWLGPEAREKLRRYGIAPPAHLVAEGEAAPGQAMRFYRRHIPCPRCGSLRSEQLSAFGATACKSLYRCLECREPFEYFKPI